MQTVHTAIEQFKQGDEIASLSLSSRRRHRLVLDLLKTEAGSTTPIARLTRAHVDGVLADRRAEGVVDATLNAYRGTLRMFGAWSLQMGYTRTNVAAHLKNTKTTTPRSKRKPVTAAQVREMLSLADVQHPRDGATLMLLIYTGCRSQEIVDLRWRDVDFEEQNISVYRSKIKDYHTAFMPDELRDALLKWRTWYEEHNGAIKPIWHVVPALAHRGFKEGKVPFRMSPEWPINPIAKQNNLRGRVQNLMFRVGETDLDGRGAHTMRRTAANLILDATGDIRAAQMLLGHASVTQTENYLDVDAQKARYRRDITNWKI